MTILLFGAEGQLGRELAVSLAALGPMTALCRSHVDLRTPLAAAAVIRSSRPQFVVNAAGYTNVDAAESEPELAQRINGDAVGEIANTLAGNARTVFGPQLDISVPACLRGVQTLRSRALMPEPLVNCRRRRWSRLACLLVVDERS